MGRTVVRKVLVREDFGRCLLLPKAEWARLPGPGKAAVVRVDGARRRVRVVSERCNCQGAGWHEHRFLALSESVEAPEGKRVRVELE